MSSYTAGVGQAYSTLTTQILPGAFDVRDDGIRFWHPGGDLKSLVVETNVHPGFMTDWQQPLVVALTQADGLSIVHETVYE
ncbi:UDP-N-acetylglucosamine 1-carboxyvinyltransferase, partial [human gut metagenome]